MVEKKITHRQRMEVCISGERPDRVPVALWRHFPVDDQTPDGLAAACINFQRNYDFDFMKVTPTSSFCLRDWGVTDQWRGNPEGTREYKTWVINQPDDWLKLPILDPKKGALGAQLECLRLLVGEYGDTLPILQTIFSPLSQAKHLLAPGMLPIYMHRFPDALVAGLLRITETTRLFIDEVFSIGITGLFYAVQHAQYGLLSDDDFQRFCKPNDLELLSAAGQSWFNLLHIHGEDLMFHEVLDYPVQVINWHDRQTSPSLAEAQAIFQGVVCGGLRQWETMGLGDPQQVMQEATDAFAQTDCQRFILGTGCVLPITTPHGNIIAARKSIRKTRLS